MCYHYNANRCIDGTLDVSAFEGPEYRYRIFIDEYAVTALHKVAENAPETSNGIRAKNHLSAMAQNDPYSEKESVFSLTIPKILRKVTLEKYK